MGAVFKARLEAQKMGILAGNITALEDVPSKVYKQFTDEDFQQMLTTLEPAVITTVCERILTVADVRTIRRMFKQGISCDIVLSPNDNPSKAALLVKARLGERAPDSWSSVDWQLTFQHKGGLAAKDIKKMDPDTLKKLMHEKSFAGGLGKFKKNQIRAFNKVIVNTYGNPSGWGATDIEAIAGGDFMSSMSVGTLRKLNATAMASKMNLFKDKKFPDRSRRAALGQKLLRGLGGRNNARSMSLQQVKDAGQFLAQRSTYLDQMDENTLKGAMRDITLKIGSRAQAASMAKRVKRMSAFKDMSTIADAELMDMAPVVPLLGKSKLRTLNPSTVANALGGLKDAPFLPEEAKILVEGLIRENLLIPNVIMYTRINSIGGLLRGMKASTLKVISATGLKECLSTIGKFDLKPAQGRVMVDAALSDGQLGSNVVLMKRLMRYVTKTELTDVTFDELNMACDGTADPMDLDLNRAQAQIIMQKAIDRMGAPSEDNSNYTSVCARQWGMAMALGFTVSQIDALATDTEVAQIVEALAPHMDGENMEESELSAWAWKIEQTTDMSQLDEITIGQIGTFFRFFSEEKLQQVPRAQIHEVCRTIGGSSMRRVPLRNIQRMFAFCQKNVNRDGVLVDLTDAATLSSDDISYLGNLLCGMVKKDVMKLTDSALMDNLPEMGNCTFDSATGEALMNNALAKISGLLTTSDNLIMAAGQLHHLSREKMNSINQEAMADAFIDIAEAVNKRKLTEKARYRIFPHEEPAEDTSGTDASAALLFQGLQAIRATEVINEPARKKRWAPALPTVTCSDIQAMGSVSSLLSADDISSLTTVDFDDCADALGSISEWKPLVLIQLGLKAKQTWGSAVSSWDVNTITTAGSIIAGLTPAEISTLNMTDPDAVFSISQHNLYSKDQLVAAFNAWMSDNTAGAGSIDAADFLIISNFVCGATNNNINGFSSIQYGESADTIGQLRCFSPEQLTAMVTHARAIYGNDVTTWTPLAISTIGTVIGGITNAEMGSLTFYQVSALIPTTLSSIPPTVLNGLTVASILGFTISQATSITSTQQMALSYEQLEALYAAGAVNMMHTSVGGMVALILCTMIVLFIVVAVVIYYKKRKGRRIMIDYNNTPCSVPKPSPDEKSGVKIGSE